MKLQIELFDYWHTGSGHGSVGYIDAEVLRDADGLPYLPGRGLKGLLLEACKLLDACDPSSASNCAASELFGTESDRGRPIELKGNYLHCSDARLPENQRKWLLAGDNRQCLPHLYDTLSSTAIEADGTRKDKSLRIIEVVLPATLEASIGGLDEAQQARIRRALPLIRGIGKNRNRGLGRCRIIESTDAAKNTQNGGQL